MSRWIAAGAIGVVAIWGLGHGHERALTAAPDPPEQHIAADEPQMSASELFQETATHEAGHVEAARAAGVPVLEVSADDTGSGETVWLTPRGAYDRAVIDAAGEEAAIAWLEQHGYTHDRALAEAEPHARSDLDQLQVDVRRAGISAQYAHEQARQLVRDHQADINRTAGLLVERGGHLDEQELER